MVRMRWPEGVEPLVYFGPSAYVVPRDGDAIIGSTMEEVGYDARTTPDAVDALRRAAAELVPAFAGGGVVEAWAGLRPMTPDQRPILGRDPDLAGLFYATGHGRNGILLGPLTAELVAAEMLGHESPVDLGPYGIARFHHAPHTTHHAP
jgi:glycine oxidase